MRPLNLDPLRRTSIGFDRLFDMIDASLRVGPDDNYPPCNILRTGQDRYRIALAVAGFGADQIDVSVQDNVLTVTGRVDERPDEGRYLHRGIATRPFVRRFGLADHVEAREARYEHGLLQIELVREVPEAMKPRRIPIGAAGAADNVRSLDQARAA